MVDTAQDEREVVAGKSILKRRVKTENKVTCGGDKPEDQQVDVKCASRGSASRRSVTFDEMITVKNDTDLVVKKSLKLVIENWKSNDPSSPVEKSAQPSPGIVLRLVDEFNTIEEKASKQNGGKSTSPNIIQNHGRVTDLINMFNSKSRNEKTGEISSKIIDF